MFVRPAPPGGSDVTLPADGVVLGIDPGLTRCGYAVLHPGQGGAVRAVAMGVIRTSSADPLPQRLADLQAEVAELIREHRPSAVAVEQVFFQSKDAVAGWGGADKEQVQRMVQKRLGLASLPKPADAADAAAIAMCHISVAPFTRSREAAAARGRSR